MRPVSTADQARRTAWDGVDRLSSLQTRGGWWTDWPAGRGGSDEFATALVTVRICGAPGAEPLVRRAAQALDSRLVVRRASGLGGWGWSAAVPGDADSTAWAVRALAAAGRPHVGDDIGDFLRGHVRDDGAATYADDAAVRRYMGAVYPEGHGFGGWTAASPSVTAAVAAVTRALAPPLVSALLRAQRDDGSWVDLWWHDPAHPTSLAAEVLLAAGHADAALAAARWSAETPTADGAFELAARLRLLVLGRRLGRGLGDGRWRSLVAQAASQLIESQDPDGSWAPSARLRVPDPDDAQPWTHDGAAPGAAVLTSTWVDEERAVSTACAVSALVLAAESFDKGLSPVQ